MPRIIHVLARLLAIAATPSVADGSDAVAGPGISDRAPYFHPKDFRPGCTTEVCAFRDEVIALHKGTDGFGMSLDDVSRHAGFAHKHHVPFALPADPQRSVAKDHGVLASTHSSISPARRATLLIDPKKSARQLLADLDMLKKDA